MSDDTGASDKSDRAVAASPSSPSVSPLRASIPSPHELADSLENSLSVAAVTPGFANDMQVWSSLAWSAQQAIAALRASEPCPYCDDTGDVVRADGEWLGSCHCVAAQANEARRAETGTGSVVDESAVGNADAPFSRPTDPDDKTWSEWVDLNPNNQMAGGRVK